MKHLTYLYLIGVIFSLNSCKNSNPERTSTKATPKLVFEWQTDSLLSTCESVLYDNSKGIIYVANVNNSPWEIDHNGFISTIDTNGKILELNWKDGLSGPKGMGKYGNTLYVNDIDKIVEIDIVEQKIVNSYKVDGEPALNDITVSPEGIVYISGSASNTVYSLKDGKIDSVASDTSGRLNGLLHQEEGIYFATSAKQEFGLINLEKKSVKILTEGLGHGDGIVRIENGDFIVSNWKGEIYYINSFDWSKELILDTKEQGIYAADIDYISEQNLLLVPTFFHNRVMCYRLVFE